MYFVGVDLAWGEQKPTGIAVLDECGHLQHLAVAHGDDDVLSQLTPWVGETCVVAFDAPLVVTNSTGTRACETALNADYRRFDAGTYPANTSLPWFADGGRGARLCAVMQLDLDPLGTASRKAMEVYPHAASVALFGLPKTLKYKQKPGRDIEYIRAELSRLTSLIESLEHHEPAICVAGDPMWTALTTAISTATSKAQLRRTEDPVDAVLCAYIAMRATTHPHTMTIYGEVATGCIVTPELRRSPD